MEEILELRNIPDQVMDWTLHTQQECFSRLLQAQLPDGSFPYYPGGKSSTEATLHAILALTAVSTERSDWQSAWQWACKQQNPDGSIGIGPFAPQEGLWLTAHLLLLSFHLADTSVGGKASQFLLGFQSKSMNQEDYVEQDNSLVGWPWTKGTFGWVEPTAWALLALKKCGMSDSPRVREGSKLLINRMIPSGGWNYGNRVVYASELLPFADTTALALMALNSFISIDQASSSLDILEKTMEQQETPYSLALISMALRLYNRPQERVQQILLERMTAQPNETINFAHWSLCLTSFSKRNPLLS